MNSQPVSFGAYCRHVNRRGDGDQAKREQSHFYVNPPCPPPPPFNLPFQTLRWLAQLWHVLTWPHGTNAISRRASQHTMHTLSPASAP